MKTIFLSSGQGSFVPGMCKSEYDRIPAFRAAIDEISTVSGEDIPSLCWGSGRVKVKNDPYLSHVTLWASNYAMTRALASAGIIPDLLMGHSLGEIIAFCLSGALSLADACRLIAHRGRLFAENRERSASDLVAVIGEIDRLKAFTADIVSVPGVYPANFNTPMQVVFAITNRDAELFSDRARKAGLRSVPLKVGNGCHSPHVSEIHLPLAEFVDSLEITDPAVPIFSCVTSGIVDTAPQVKDILRQHVLCPVHWWETLDTLAANSTGDFRLIDLSYSNAVKGLILGWSADAPLCQAEALLKETRNAC